VVVLVGGGYTETNKLCNRRKHKRLGISIIMSWYFWILNPWKFKRERL